MAEKIREPMQKRAIEKKQRIIKAGFDLICERGYYNVNTAEIAKEAGVSTGIVYSYFKDKKDIFLEGVREYSNSVMYPSIDIDNFSKIDKNNFRETVEFMIDSFIKKHRISKEAHEELIAMSHLDSEVAKIFNEAEMRMTDEAVKLLTLNNFKIDNMAEKIHLLIGIIENLCHEIVYHKHKDLDSSAMKEIVVGIFIDILKV